MSDPNPVVRSRALESFRKTTGLETGGGVQVNVNQQTAVVQNGQVRSFEEALDAVRRRHAQTETDRNATPEPSRDLPIPLRTKTSFDGSNSPKILRKTT